MKLPEWMDRAACDGMDPALFFPPVGESTAQAKAVCQGCAVRPQCLDYALTHGQYFGIWGGTSERQRKQMRKRAA